MKKKKGKKGRKGRTSSSSVQEETGIATLENVFSNVEKLISKHDVEEMTDQSEMMISGEESGEEISDLLKTDEEIDDSGEEIGDSGEEIRDSGEEIGDSNEGFGDSGEEVGDSGEEIGDSGEEMGYVGKETSKEEVSTSPKKKAKKKAGRVKKESTPATKKADINFPPAKKKTKSPSPKKEAKGPSAEKKAESPPRKKKAKGPPAEKKAELSPRKKKEKAKSPPVKKRAESPPHKKKAKGPPAEKKAATPPPKKKTKSPPAEKKAESPKPKKKAMPSRKKIAGSPEKPLTPPPKKKKLGEKAVPAIVKKEGLDLKKDKKKGGARKKKGSAGKKKGGAGKKKGKKRKKAAAISKQEKEKEAEEQKLIEHELHDQPTEEGAEAFKEPKGKEAVHDPLAAAKEKERKEEQLQEVATILDFYDTMLQEEKIKDWEEEQWKRYLERCGEADPLITCEANGYITTWQDLTEDEDAMSILRETRSCLELLSELELAIEESPDQNPEKIAAWILTHKNLHELLQDKLDKATYKLLKSAANYLDPDNYNMKLVTSDVRATQDIIAEKIDEAEMLLLENNAPILLCLWANLVRNPKFKGPNFSQIGHSIELPRPVLLKDCALRILHTSFNPYTYLLNEKQRLQEQINEKPKESDEENSELGGDAATASAALTATSLQTESTAPVVQSTVTKPSKRRKKQAKAVKAPRLSEIKPIPTEIESDKRDDEDDELSGSLTTSTKHFLPQQIVDMKSNYILGGVYHIDFVAIPPLPVTSGIWILEQLEKDQKLQSIKYLVDITPPRPPKSSEKPTQAAMYAEAENRRYEDELTSAVSVTLKLPELVLFLDQPQLAFWDEDNAVWVNEGFHELKYNEDNRSLTFKMAHFGVIGIVQNKYVNFPYQAWELKPNENCNNCSLRVTGSQVSMIIEISGGKCCLSELQTLEDSISHTELCNEWMKAQQLLKKLKNVGIYVVPDQYATSYLGTVPKIKGLEDKVYKSMSMFADVYFFGSSRWNSTVGKKKIVMKYNLTCGKEIEGIKSLLLVEHEKALFLQCTEHASSFREDPLGGSECCTSLPHLLLSATTSEGLIRLNKSKEAYYSCIYKLLSSMKLLSF